MKLIVGLGNIGMQYENTRHNMGFAVIDKFAEMVKVDIDRSKFNGLYTIVKNPAFEEDFILAKPSTYMNLSGQFVSPMMSYFKVSLDELLVIYDDMAIEEGKIRLRPFGSSGSHNGMKSIISSIGSDKFKRIRVGIGEPPHGGADYVLSKIDNDSREKLDIATTNASKAIRDYLLHDFNYAMNHYNK
ncbi:MAG: aminoacyl-tRNA hydrolase [Mollicutes bacterium]|nr:aminoacyl-tRNA hydrolase [Mollicutes bacterium]MDY3904919.1 aminoacyl-tRNA hydrolase [Candidatus Enteromonas sp.]